VNGSVLVTFITEPKHEPEAAENGEDPALKHDVLRCVEDIADA
jgi:hypothetical protein